MLDCFLPYLPCFGEMNHSRGIVSCVIVTVAIVGVIIIVINRGDIARKKQ